MKKNWYRYSKLLIWLAIILAMVLLPLVAVKSTQAATLGFTTMGWNTNKVSWQEGNIGTWPEGQFVGSLVRISNTSSKPIQLTEIDLRYSFYDGSKSIGVDYARNFY